MGAAEIRPAGRVPIVIAAVLTAATAFFVWGVLAERAGHRESEESEETRAQATDRTSEASEGSEHSEEGEGATEEGHQEDETAGEHREAEEFRPLGINLESPPLVFAGAALSLALAGLVVARPKRAVLLAVVLFGAGFTVLEIIEVKHQADLGNTGILVLALIAGILHASAAVLAAVAYSGRRRGILDTVG